MFRSESKNGMQFRLSASLAAMLLLVLASSGVTIWRMGSLHKRTGEVTRTVQARTRLASKLSLAVDQMAAAQQTLFTRAIGRDQKGLAEARQSFAEGSSEAKLILAGMEAHLQHPKDRQLHGSIEQALDAWTGVFPQIERLCERGSAAAASRLGAAKTMSLLVQARHGTAELMLLQEEMQAGLFMEAESTQRSLLWMLALVCGLSLLAGVPALAQVHWISQRLSRISTVVSESSEQLDQAAKQIRSASQSLAHGASEQAATIEQTSASSVEIQSMAEANAAKTLLVSSFMCEMDTQVIDANHALEEMVVSMGDINSSSNKIAHIIKIIDEIAFQTNLLALNGAVEAARAGGAGMGFAVVAEEVRRLAQRSAQAAKDTEHLIHDSIQSSKQGKFRLDQVTGAIKTITEGSSRMRALVEEVNSGSQEQSHGIDQIRQAVALMDTVTRNVAGQAEQTASSGLQMASLGETLRHGVLQLQQMVGTGSQPEQASARKVRENRATALPPAKQAPGRQRGLTPVRSQLRKLDVEAEAESVIPLGDFKEY